MGGGILNKQSLRIRIHDPNPKEITAAYIAKIMLEASQVKVEHLLREISTESYIDDKDGPEQ